MTAKGKEAEYSEADVGSKFILPLIGDVLGWHVDDIDEVKEQRRTLSGPVDYALMIDRRPRLLLELKKFTESLDGYREVRGRKETFPEQATRYAWQLKVEWVVLTNFKEIRLYNSYYRKPEGGLRFQLRYADFVSGLDRLWIVSRESVESGELDKIERKAERKNIDEAVLEDLLEIRRRLSADIRSNNSSLGTEVVKECVQKIMDRLLVIRVSEDRGTIGFESLYRELASWKNRGLPTPFMRSLKSLFRDFDDTYNSKLFAPHVCEDLTISNGVLMNVIDTLYQYNFDVISADVLGAIYEDYIGHVLEEATAGGVQIIESREARKKEGIYYTPTHLVEYVVRDTLGALLEKCNSPEQVSRIRVVDPACGSGSFLIKAFDLFREWYGNYNRKLNTETKLDERLQAITDVERKILTENLFGVDIDPQAAEIAAVNLMLKAVKHNTKLPQILDQNIMVGNALVSDTDKGFETLSERAKQDLRPFRWEEKFSEIFATGGFDVVIGNPPYYKVRKTNPIRVSPSFEAVKTGPVNAAMMFLDRAVKLAKPGGYVGLVLPKMLTYTKGWEGTRRIALLNTIRSIVDCQEAFEGVLLEQVLLTLQKAVPAESWIYHVGQGKAFNIEISSARIAQSAAEDEDLIFLEPNDIAYAIRQKMLSGSVRLDSICKIVLGEGIQSYKCFRETQRRGDLAILRGDDVQMWHTRGCLYFSPSASEMQQFKNNMAELSVPHIVAQRIVAHIRYPKPHIILMAAYDTKGSFAFNTVTHFILEDPNYDYRYILGLLNSKLFSFYAYKFIYNNAVRSMDFYPDYAGRLPVRKLPSNEQEHITDVVDRIVAHFCNPSRRAPQYRKYFTERVVRYRELGEYYNRLDPNDRDPRDMVTTGAIKALRVREEGEWLSFRVDFLDKTQRKIVVDHEVLRCRFEDGAIRVFLMNELNAGRRITRGKRRGGKRLLDRALSFRLPSFDRSNTIDEDLIRKQLEPYLKDYDAHLEWEKEYAALVKQLDREVYEIYGLAQQEISHVEEHSRQSEWHVD